MTAVQKVQNTIAAANATTGATDTDMTTAVQRLIDGYGGGSLPYNFTKFASGTFTPAENIHDYTITHGLGVVPDLVLVMPIDGTATASATNGILLAGRELQNTTEYQWYTYGSSTFHVNAVSSSRSIYNASATHDQGLKYADANNMTICTHNGATYYWCADVTYRWLAFAQEGINETV